MTNSSQSPIAIASAARSPPSRNAAAELTAAAERHGWPVVAEFADEGISGAKGRDQRPAFDRLCKAIVRHEFDVVAA